MQINNDNFFQKKITNGQNYQAVSKLCLSTNW